MGSGSISYQFSPGDTVYVIDSTPCISGTTPINAFYTSGGSDWCGSLVYPGTASGLYAIRKGTVIELDTTQLVTSSTPTLIYSVRFGSSSPGTKKFPQTALFAGTPVTSGSQTINYNATYTSLTTTLTFASQTYTATVTVDGAQYAISVDLSTIGTIGALLTVINTQLQNSAVIALNAGNITITSIATGDTSTVLITDTGSFPLFSSLAGFVAFFTSVAGTNGGLEAALVAYGLLVA